MKPKEIDYEDCRVVLTSPQHYEECVVEVETTEDLVFIVTDEQRTGACTVELPGDGENIVRRISLQALRALLDAAEEKLVGHGRPKE